MRADLFRKARALWLWALLLLSPSLPAQFSQARLQATGLTCALCSKAIHESLSQLPFVDSVRAELKSSSFDIRFKSGMTQSLTAMRSAVEEAGFFIGELTLRVSRPLTDEEKQSGMFTMEGVTYQMLDTWQNNPSVQVVGKGFMGEKQFRQVSGRYADRMNPQGQVVYLLPVKL